MMTLVLISALVATVGGIFYACFRAPRVKHIKEIKSDGIGNKPENAYVRVKPHATVSEIPFSLADFAKRRPSIKKVRGPSKDELKAAAIKARREKLIKQLESYIFAETLEAWDVRSWSVRKLQKFLHETRQNTAKFQGVQRSGLLRAARDACHQLQLPMPKRLSNGRLYRRSSLLERAIMEGGRFPRKYSSNPLRRTASIEMAAAA